MRILFVASECFPYVKTGGLADVAASLPPALRALGADVRLLLPGYPGVLDRLRVMRTVRSLPSLPGLPDGARARLLGSLGEDDLTVYALDAPAFFAREGNPYQRPDGRDWPDNHLRFAALCRTAALMGLEGDGDGWVPDIIHGHDWQAGLVPAYLRHAGWVFDGKPVPGTVFTIHNLAFQGLFPPDVLRPLGLPSDTFTHEELEYYGKVGFLKAGLVYSDRLTTVSPTYAHEIQGWEMGFGLDGVLRRRANVLSGILNGIDLRHWDPATDPFITQRYDSGQLDRRAANKADLQRAFGLEVRPDALLFGVVSRLTHQKGIDLIVQALPRIMGLGGQVAVLGTGSAELEQALADASADHKGRVGLRLAYDEGLSHRVQAGADVLMVPSRFEPCGLTQMYALRYGTLPLVTPVGGLADTVADVTEAALAHRTATGFVTDAVDLPALLRAVERAAGLYRHGELWRQVQRTAMGRDVGWEASAQAYLGLYTSLQVDSTSMSQ